MNGTEKHAVPLIKRPRRQKVPAARAAKWNQKVSQAVRNGDMGRQDQKETGSNCWTPIFWTCLDHFVRSMASTDWSGLSASGLGGWNQKFGHLPPFIILGLEMTSFRTSNCNFGFSKSVRTIQNSEQMPVRKRHEFVCPNDRSMVATPSLCRNGSRISQAGKAKSCH